MISFFKKYSTNVDIHTRTSTYFMNARTHTQLLWAPLKDWAGLDLEIHEVGHQKHLAVDGDIVFH
jgi:hypothetical protein